MKIGDFKTVQHFFIQDLGMHSNIARELYTTPIRMEIKFIVNRFAYAQVGGQARQGKFGEFLNCSTKL